MSFNQQIMNLFFDFFLRVKLYQLQCFFINHILNSILDTHTKRWTFWSIVVNILISNNIQHLYKVIYLILDTFKLQQVSSHHPHHMSKLHIASTSERLHIMFINTIHLIQFCLGNMSTFFWHILEYIKKKLSDSLQYSFFIIFFFVAIFNLFYLLFIR